MANKKINYWLIKSEPNKYSWDQLEKDGETFWDGVRNFEARNNLREMKKGDLLLYYHSNEGKEVVGIAKVKKESFQDPTTDDERWLAIDVEPFKKLKKPVSLATMKATPQLQGMKMVRQGRISVTPVTAEEFDKIIELSEV
jgi:predicted RNA-binding protein with PUA-like domain